MGFGTVVPGLPVIGNLLQLKEKKPYKTFAQMAEKHGPIYSIRTGASTIIVLNSALLAKEVSLSYPYMSTVCHGSRYIFCQRNLCQPQEKIKQINI